MKTPLTEILKRVTPLLPAVSQCNKVEGCGQEAFVMLNDGKTKVRVPIYIEGTGKFLGRKQHFMLARYMAHTANNFPALVEALDKVLASANPHPLEHKAMHDAWCDARLALKSAQQVEGV